MTEAPTNEYLTDCNHVFALFIKQAMNKSITLNMDEMLYYGIQICTFFVILYLLVPAKLIWCLFVILLVIMFVIYIVGRIYSVGFGKKINEKQKFDPEKIAKLSKLLET